MAKVSVVIPVYNPGKYLLLAIKSVISQTFVDWELLVIDDGSTECLSFAVGLDARVRLIRQHNGGQSSARNKGIWLSTGEYVAFLDQDDLWMPTKVERQVMALDGDPNAQFCHTQFLLIDGSGLSRGPGFGRHQTYRQMLNGSGVCGASTVMARRESLIAAGLFDSLFEPAEDYDLWLRLSRKQAGCFIASVEASYRLHGNNQTRNYRNTHSAIRSILRKHADFAIRARDEASAAAARIGTRRIRSLYAGQAFDAARQARKDKQWRAGLRHLMYAARHCPLLLTRWIGGYVARWPWRRGNAVTEGTA